MSLLLPSTTRSLAYTDPVVQGLCKPENVLTQVAGLGEAPKLYSLFLERLRVCD